MSAPDRQRPTAGAGEILLAAAGLEKRYPRRGALGRRRRGSIAALAGVDLELRRGECLAVVGESGSGKTTLALCLMRLIEPSAGRVTFDGEDLLALPPSELRRCRRRFQMIYQDPYDSLDPRQRIGAALAEPLRLHHLVPSNAAGALSAPRQEPADGQAQAPADRPPRPAAGAVRRRVVELLARVGLPAATAERYPHELSGGQRQRVGIARALAVEPELLVADEPVSALDVSVRSQILNLLANLQQSMGLTVLLIAHDLATVEQMADRVAVFYLGRIVELAPRAELFARPLHPYTVSLLASVPRPWPPARPAASERPAGPAGAAAAEFPAAVAGQAGADGLFRRTAPAVAGVAGVDAEPPISAEPPPGCPFQPRCPVAQPRCRVERPELLAATGRPRRYVACFYPGTLPGPGPGGEAWNGPPGERSPAEGCATA